MTATSSAATAGATRSTRSPTSAPAAAEIALELQDALAAFDYATLGLDGAGGMRIGAHYGPA